MTRLARLLSGNIPLVAAVGASLLMFPHISHAKEDLSPPAQARAMTAAELHAIYADRSWQWPEGAGRMETKDRRFTAISGSGESATWAEGRWTVSDAGRLCFVAAWHTKAGVSSKRTCFLHKFDAGNIYQQREPGGKWYVFKHAKPTATDEFNKLIRQDLVSAKLERRMLGNQSKKKP